MYYLNYQWFNTLKEKEVILTTTLFPTCKLCEESGEGSLLTTFGITAITSKLKTAFT